MSEERQCSFFSVKERKLEHVTFLVTFLANEREKECVPGVIGTANALANLLLFAYHYPMHFLSMNVSDFVHCPNCLLFADSKIQLKMPMLLRKSKVPKSQDFDSIRNLHYNSIFQKSIHFHGFQTSINRFWTDFSCVYQYILELPPSFLCILELQ